MICGLGEDKRTRIRKKKKEKRENKKGKKKKKNLVVVKSGLVRIKWHAETYNRLKYFLPHLS